MINNLSRAVGDKHNGKSVLKFGNWYFKPREIEIERAFLSFNSFRVGLSEGLIKDLGYSIIDQFAALRFFRLTPNFGLVSGFHPKESEFNSTKFNPEHLGSIGAVLLWFGIGDLHSDNLKLGIDTNKGQWFLSPVDLEILFEEIISLRQNLLLPFPNDSDPHLSGFYNLLEVIRDNEKAFIRGFSDSLESLEFRKSRILELLVRHTKIMSSQIRVVLRPTSSYKNYLHGNNRNENFCIEELAQLKKGDIPFFFRFLSSPKIFWIRNGKVTPTSLDLLDYKIPRQLTYEEFYHRKRTISLLVEILKNDLFDLQKSNSKC